MFCIWGPLGIKVGGTMFQLKFDANDFWIENLSWWWIITCDKVIKTSLCERYSAIAPNVHFPFDLLFSIKLAKVVVEIRGEVEFYSPSDPHGASSLKHCVMPKNLTAHKMRAIFSQKMFHCASRLCIIFGCKVNHTAANRLSLDFSSSWSYLTPLNRIKSTNLVHLTKYTWELKIMRKCQQKTWL